MADPILAILRQTKFDFKVTFTPEAYPTLILVSHIDANKGKTRNPRPTLDPTAVPENFTCWVCVCVVGVIDFYCPV